MGSRYRESHVLGLGRVGSGSLYVLVSGGTSMELLEERRNCSPAIVYMHRMQLVEMDGIEANSSIHGLGYRSSHGGGNVLL